MALVIIAAAERRRRRRLRHGGVGDIEHRRPVAAHVAAERLSGGEHHAARVAAVDVAGGPLAGARAEQEVEAVGAHPRAVVAGPVAAERLERGEAAAAGATPERPVRTVRPVVVPAAAGLGDHLARRRQRQVEQQVHRRRSCGGGGHAHTRQQGVLDRSRRCTG